MSEKEVRVGFIGAGRINQTHMEILARQTAVELVGVADNVIDKAKQLADIYGIKACSDYRELLDGPQIDAIWLATPPNNRLSICRDAIDAGKHIMAEKPIARTVQEAEEIVDLVEKGEVKFMVGFMKRFAPRFVKAHEIVKKHELGSPIWCVAYYNGPPNIWYSPSWCWDVDVSGGLLVENTSHYIDIMRWLVDSRVVGVYASLDKLYKKDGSVEDSGGIILHFDKPLIGLIACGMNSPERFPHEDLKLVCTEGALSAEASLTFLPAGFVENSNLTIYKDGVPEIVNWEFSTAGYEEEDIYFLKTLREGRDPSPSAREAKDTLEIAVAALYSVDTGQRIQIPLKEDYKRRIPTLWKEQN